ncbi:DUF4124 domain-containing protein [Marinobacter halodurans]|uniref:DUF4124 domain-containing protein n=1 Tax=Marinobacter halodurans TaxID=2528979 RepID=A0ABY1ZPD5_9GAMM|nr:DUF4124 domain-containing protein [Marinobacter halodurans]TBW55911.1 DUF4124 domain-containing protein [Marinobacter halodurans]
MKKLWVVFGLLTLAVTSAQAQVYKSVDKHGNVTYTDEASSGGEPVDVKPVTTVTLPKADQVKAFEERQKKEANNKQKPASRYSRIGFDSPENDSAFHSGSGDVTFAVSSQPPLRPGDLFEVSLDGQPIGQNASGQFPISNVFRGTHNASVRIVDKTGNIIQDGQTITFTIHRPSVQN